MCSWRASLCPPFDGGHGYSKIDMHKRRSAKLSLFAWRGPAVTQTVAWHIKAPPYPAPQAVPPENLPDHQAASGPEPNGRVAPEPDKIAVCEGNVNFDMHTGLGCTELQSPI